MGVRDASKERWGKEDQEREGVKGGLNREAPGKFARHLVLRSAKRDRHLTGSETFRCKEMPADTPTPSVTVGSKPEPLT